MYLKKLDILNFKNISSASFDFSSNINCFTGLNGAGKTNIIDAVHYMSLCKSAFNISDNQCVKHEEEFFMIDGEYDISSESYERIVCSYSSSKGKVVKRNGKEYNRLSEHIGLLPLVMVCPADTALINDGSEERRRFLNSFISQIDREYLDVLVRYNSVLAGRNKLLKELNVSPQYELIDVLDMQLDSLADKIYNKRKDCIERLKPKVEYYYKELSLDREQVELNYKSAVSESSLGDLLKLSRDKDRIMGHTTVGIHRDNIDFRIMDYPIRKYGSQGQQKSFLIALKLAQFDIISEMKGFSPALLLDDIFDKLDLGRVERLISLVSEERFGQIFITDSNKVRIEGILKSLTAEHALFRVDGGNSEKI